MADAISEDAEIELREGDDVNYHDRWRARLNKVPTPAYEIPEVLDSGYYRKPVTVKTPGGATKKVDYIPVILFPDANGDLCGIIGRAPVEYTEDDLATDKELTEIWTWCIKHPVDEDHWREVAQDGKPWREFRGEEIPAADRDVTAGDNAPPEDIDPIDEYAISIKNAADAALTSISSAEDAAKVAGSLNRLSELRIDCDKAGKAIYKPLFEDYTKEQKRCSAPVKVAETKEASLKKMLLTWQESERKRLAKEAEDAAAKLDIAATPEPVAAPAPIVPTHGTRKVKAPVLKWPVFEDYAAALAHFGADDEIRARVEKLATAAVRAGTKVPGVAVREGVI